MTEFGIQAKLILTLLRSNGCDTRDSGGFLTQTIDVTMAFAAASISRRYCDLCDDGTSTHLAGSGALNARPWAHDHSLTALFEIHWELVKLRNKMLSEREHWTVVVPRGFSVWNGCRRYLARRV